MESKVKLSWNELRLSRSTKEITEPAYNLIIFNTKIGGKKEEIPSREVKRSPDERHT